MNFSRILSTVIASHTLALYVSCRKDRVAILIVGIAAILISYLLPMSDFYRLITLTLLLLLYLFGGKERYENFHRLNTSNYLVTNLMSLLVVMIITKTQFPPSRIFQFLTFGYDNALHFSLFRVFTKEQQYYFGLNSSWVNDFGLFHTYPPGYSALWSFAYNSFLGSNNTNVGNLMLFFFLANITLLFVVYIQSVDLILRFSRYPQKWKLSVLIVTTPPVLYFWGLLLTNGFAPYLLGVSILLSYNRILLNSYKPEKVLLFTYVATFILIAITPAIIWLVLLPGLHLFKIVFIDDLELSRIKVSNASALIFLATISLIVYKNTTSTFGWRQMLGPGGVQPPNLFLSILIVFLFFYVIIYQQRRGQEFLVALSLIGLGVSVVVYSALTFFLTGSIQYYAVKQGLVFLGVACVYIIARVTQIQNFSILRMSTNRSISYLILLWSLIFVTAFLNPKVYTSAFMGNIIQTTREVTTKNSWNEQIVDVNLIKSLLNYNKFDKNSCQIIHLAGEEGDLNSRWLNALQQNNPMTQDCFMAFWNSTNLSLKEIYESKISSNTSYTIFVNNESINEDSVPSPGNVYLVPTP
jgi:hypothetical protein